MNISIIGAGIAGLCAAIALRRAGLQATIYEAAAEVRGAGAGIGLAPNAIMALRKLRLADRVLPLGRELDAFAITTRTGKIISSTSSDRVRDRFGIDNFTIHRAQLHRALLDELDGTPIVTGKVLEKMEVRGNQHFLHFRDGSTVVSDVVLAADGINSKVRDCLAPGAQKRYAGYTCWRGVVQAPDLELSEASEIWDARGRIGIVPLPEGQVYWFACINAPAADPALAGFGARELQAHFAGFHGAAGSIIGRTADAALIHNDIYDLAPLPRFAYGQALLLGDAAHAATPNMGQGACQAIEDAAVLLSLLERGARLPDVFPAFEQRRLGRTRYVVDQSRKIGRMAQLSNPLLAGVRDWLLGRIPARLREQQLTQLYNVSF